MQPIASPLFLEPNHAHVSQRITTRWPFWFYLAVISICVYAAVLAWLRFSPTFDQFWHIETGRALINLGLSPYVDHFSYTFNGEAISHQPVAFQVAYAWLDAAFGLDVAGTLLKAGSAVLFIGLLLFFLYKIRVDYLTASVALSVATLFFLTRLIPRPEIFDQVLMIVAFILGDRLRRRFDPPTLLLCCFLIWVWSNFHAAILGYVIFAGAFIDIASRRFEEFETVKVSSWLAWGIALVALGFLQPSLEHPLWAALTFSDEWTSISEHQPSPPMLSLVPSLYALWTGGAILLAWAFLVGRFGLAITIAVFLWASIDRVRMISFAGVAFACTTALLATDDKTQMLKRDMPRLLRYTTAFVALFITATAVAYLNFQGPMKRNSANGFPNDSLAYIEKEDLRGDILNLYRWGGWLTYHLGDRLKVFIDGRTNILYDEKHYVLYKGLTVDNRAATATVKSLYPPDLALWEHDPQAHMNITRGLGLKAEFIGLNSVLYSPTGKLQALSDIAMFPACISQNPSVFIDTESKLATVGKNHEQLVEYLGEITSSPQVAQNNFENVFRLNDNAPDWLRRAMAHWLISNKDYQSATQAWLSIKNHSTLDLIYAAFTATKANQTGLANRFLAGALIENPFRIDRPVTKQQTILISGLIQALDSADALIAENKDMYQALVMKYELTDHDMAAASSVNDFVSRTHCRELSINPELTLSAPSQ